MKTSSKQTVGKILKIALYIPVLNEERSYRIIKKNISQLLKIHDKTKIVFSNNFSNDNTLDKLNKIKSLYPKNVRIYNQKNRVSFGENLSFIKNCKNLTGYYIILCGAHDILHKPGFKNLLKQLRKNDKADLIICNWGYYKKNNYIRFTTHDFRYPLAYATNLDIFFTNHLYVPNGIMQWVLKKELFDKIQGKPDPHNPHIDLFFRLFPCNCVLLGGEPIFLVKLLEKTGWRSASTSIFKQHAYLTKKVIQNLQIAYKNKKISKYPVLKIKKIYIRNLINLFFSFYQKKPWAPFRQKNEHAIFFLVGAFELIKLISSVDILFGIGHLRYFQKKLSNLIITNK